MNKIGRRALLGFLGSAIAVPIISHGKPLDLGQFFSLSPQQCTPETCYSSVAPPGYEVPGMTKSYIIRLLRTDTPLERTRQLTNILGPNAAGLVNDVFIQVAIDAKVADLLPLIGERIQPGKSGYLLRINLVVDPTSGNHLASPNLIEMVGAGTEPLDALAESYRIGSITGTQPKLLQVRKYLWCTREEEDIKVSYPNEVLSTHLENKANIEANRRRLLGLSGVNSVAPELSRINQAEFWQDFANARTREINNQTDRFVIENLNNQFQISQQKFNEAYVEFQNVQSEMVANAREQALLSNVSKVLGALSTGLSAYNQLGAGPSATESSESALRWRENQSRILNSASERSRTTLDFNLPALRQLDAKIREEWTRMGVGAPKTEWIPPGLM